MSTSRPTNGSRTRPERRRVHEISVLGHTRRTYGSRLMYISHVSPPQTSAQPVDAEQERELFDRDRNMMRTQNRRQVRRRQTTNMPTSWPPDGLPDRVAGCIGPARRLPRKITTMTAHRAASPAADRPVDHGSLRASGGRPAVAASNCTTLPSSVAAVTSKRAAAVDVRFHASRVSCGTRGVWSGSVATNSRSSSPASRNTAAQSICRRVRRGARGSVLELPA